MIHDSCSGVVLFVSESTAPTADGRGRRKDLASRSHARRQRHDLNLMPDRVQCYAFRSHSVELSSHLNLLAQRARFLHSFPCVAATPPCIIVKAAALMNTMTGPTRYVRPFRTARGNCPRRYRTRPRTRPHDGCKIQGQICTADHHLRSSSLRASPSSSRPELLRLGDVDSNSVIQILAIIPRGAVQTTTSLQAAHCIRDVIAGRG